MKEGEGGTDQLKTNKKSRVEFLGIESLWKSPGPGFREVMHESVAVPVKEHSRMEVDVELKVKTLIN